MTRALDCEFPTDDGSCLAAPRACGITACRASFQVMRPPPLPS